MENLKWMRVKNLWERRKLNWFVIKIKYGYARHQAIADPLFCSPSALKFKPDSPVAS